jgi:hypothetical protein
MSAFQQDRHGRLYDPITGSIVGAMDANGNEQFTAAAVGTIAQMLATTPAAGAMFRTTDTFQVNGVVNPVGNEWVYDGTQWRPRGNQRIVAHTSIITGALQTAEQVIKTITLPVGILYLQRFRIDFAFGKTGTTDAANLASLRLGTAGTTADAQIVASAASILVAGKRSIGVSINFESVSTTSLQRRGTAGQLDNGSFIASSTATALQAATAVSNMLTSALKLSVTMGMATAATDSPQAGEIFVTIEP